MSQNQEHNQHGRGWNRPYASSPSWGSSSSSGCSSCATSPSPMTPMSCSSPKSAECKMDMAPVEHVMTQRHLVPHEQKTKWVEEHTTTYTAKVPTVVHAKKVHPTQCMGQQTSSTATSGCNKTNNY